MYTPERLVRQVNWDEFSGPAGNRIEPGAITGGKKTALTVGVFDGLHRGHQALMQKVTAKAPELLPAVVTFRSPPPKPSSGTGLEIVTFEEKIALLDDLGLALCVIIDFSEHFSKISGRAFLEALHRHLCPAYIAVGFDFHCGYRRGTDAEAFKALAEDLGIEAEIVPPVLEGGLPISSSRIRAALGAGKASEASLLLGRTL